MKYIRKTIEEDPTVEEMMQQKELSYRRLALVMKTGVANLHRAITGKIIPGEETYLKIKEAVHKY